MKKKMIWLLAVFALTQCEVKVRETNATTTAFSQVYTKETQTIGGMEYMVWYVYPNSSQTGYCVYSINITKDKLEVEWLKRQIANDDSLKIKNKKKDEKRN